MKREYVLLTDEGRERLRRLVDEDTLRHTAKTIGISGDYLKSVLKGKNKPGYDIVSDLCILRGVDPTQFRKKRFGSIVDIGGRPMEGQKTVDSYDHKS